MLNEPSDTRRNGKVSSMTTEDANRSAVNIRTLDIEHFHVELPEKMDQWFHRVITQMLVEHVVVVELLHGVQPVLGIGREDTAFSQQLFDAQHDAGQIGDMGKDP